MVAYGRKIVPRTLETPDGPVTYWRKIRMYATSYSPARSGTPKSAPWYGRTRIGLKLRKGIVAVDPKVIPLQSWVYVPGYGKAIAGDTGGGIKGKWIDMGFDDFNYEVVALVDRCLRARSAAGRVQDHVGAAELSPARVPAPSLVRMQNRQHLFPLSLSDASPVL